MKAFKYAALGLAVFLGVSTLGLVAFKLHLNATYFEGYDPSAPLDPAVTDVKEMPEANPAYVRVALDFNGLHGKRVPTLLALPLDAAGRLPCVIFLHGIGQKKDFLDEIAAPFTQAGFAFCSFDQHMCGERKRKYKNILQEGRAFLQRPAYTVNDTRRLIDYLQTRPDVAWDRIYLVGASYGAITGSTAAAFDERIRAVGLVYGGGNVRQMLTARAVAKEIGGWLPLAQVLGVYLLGQADPVKYAGQIAPRPVLLQNGTDDCLIATKSAVALQNAVREPKTIKWYEGDHIGFDRDTVITVLNEVLAFIKEQDAKITGNASKAAA